MKNKQNSQLIQQIIELENKAKLLYSIVNSTIGQYGCLKDNNLLLALMPIFVMEKDIENIFIKAFEYFRPNEALIYSETLRSNIKDYIKNYHKEQKRLKKKVSDDF